MNSKLSFVDLEDVAEVAKNVMAGPNHINTIYELAGTLPLSQVEAAEMFSGALNRDVQAEREELGAWRLRAVGMSEYAIENLVKMFDYYDQWGLTGNPNVLRWLLRREPTSLATLIERTMKERNVVH